MPPPPLPLPLPLPGRPMPLPPPPQRHVVDAPKDPKFKTPQRQLFEFWKEFHHQAPGKVTTILPRDLYKTLVRSHHSTNDPSVRNAAASYEVAAEACKAKVASIVKHCEMTNEKFTDPDFDIQKEPFDCLHRLEYAYPHESSSEASGSGSDSDSDSDSHGRRVSAKVRAKKKRSIKMRGEATKMPSNRRVEGKRSYGDAETVYYGSIHRVDWIFDKPQFTIDGYSASDIRQGSLGNCWWLAAVATIAHRQDLMDKVMVARNEKCGVYGFVFHRDGEWVYTVVDDNLFLTNADFTHYGDTYDPSGKLAREHRKTNQTGSRALVLGSCEDENETWLPLLEKAYAKVHNDFTSISGGFAGEGVEDMTGGCNSYLFSSTVLSRDRLWKELLNESGEFVFSLGLSSTGWEYSRGGMATGHAYSLLKAVEVEGLEGEKLRMVKIRNPWGVRNWMGEGEWTGPWSDGSAEWTSYWLEKLDHKFGDDGVFWMTFEDMLDHYEELNRTRLFNNEWTVAQRWTSAGVPWVTGYLQKKFIIEVKTGGLCVVILSQLDERYWKGLEGKYMFELYFLLIKEGGNAEDIAGRARCHTQWDSRSISCEVNLEPGRYELLPKVVAVKRPGGHEVVRVVKTMADINANKLRQVGMQYDIAHARPGVADQDEIMEEERAKRKRKEDMRKKKEKENEKKVNEKQKVEDKKRKALAARDKEKEKKRIERVNKKKAKRRIQRLKRIEAKAKAKNIAKKEKARKKEGAKAEAAADAAADAEVRKESTPESEKDRVLVKKEDADEAQTAKPEADQAQGETITDSADVKTTKEAKPDSEAEEQESETEKGTQGADEPLEPLEPEDSKKATNEEDLEDGNECSKSKVDASEKKDEKEEEEDDDSDLDSSTESEVSSDEEFGSDGWSSSSSESESGSDAEECFENEIPSGWNPVVVLGLRCYSKDKELRVTVVDPEDPKENTAATLAAEASLTGDSAPL